MCSSPEGEGSISSTYVCCSGAASGSGFGTANARSSSQTRCHFASTAWGSYLSSTIRFLPTKKPLVREAHWKPARRRPRSLPALSEQLLHRRHFTTAARVLTPAACARDLVGP